MSLKEAAYCLPVTEVARFPLKDAAHCFLPLKGTIAKFRCDLGIGAFAEFGLANDGGYLVLLSFGVRLGWFCTQEWRQSANAATRRML
jgi:hypothetical protein